MTHAGAEYVLGCISTHVYNSLQSPLKVGDGGWTTIFTFGHLMASIYWKNNLNPENTQNPKEKWQKTNHVVFLNQVEFECKA